MYNFVQLILSKVKIIVHIFITVWGFRVRISDILNVTHLAIALACSFASSCWRQVACEVI